MHKPRADWQAHTVACRSLRGRLRTASAQKVFTASLVAALRPRPGDAVLEVGTATAVCARAALARIELQKHDYTMEMPVSDFPGYP